MADRGSGIGDCPHSQRPLPLDGEMEIHPLRRVFAGGQWSIRTA